MHGFCAETTSAVTGVGAIERRARVNWRKVIEIFYTWIFTIPGAAIISGFLFFIYQILY